MSPVPDALTTRILSCSVLLQLCSCLRWHLTPVMALESLARQKIRSLRSFLSFCLSVFGLPTLKRLVPFGLNLVLFHMTSVLFVGSSLLVYVFHWQHIYRSATIDVKLNWSSVSVLYSYSLIAFDLPLFPPFSTLTVIFMII